MKDKSPEEIQELRSALTRLGIEELNERQDVDEFLARSGTSMIVVNSVCGCAGEAIREGVAEAIEELELDHAGTVFAGEDEEATEEVRSRAPEDEPSSPCIYLYKDGEKVTYIPRSFTLKHQYDAEKVTEKLQNEVDRLRQAQPVT